jgi:hypothetical protein
VLFAGRRRNEDLGRSDSSRGYPPARRDAPMTADVRRAPRRGTPSACATYAHAPDAGTRDRRMRPGTRPSLGPSTRARRSSLCSAGASLGGGAATEASRLGKPAQAGGTSTGVFGTGRSAARRVSPLPQGRGRDTSRKGRRSRSPSLRGSFKEPGFGCPHVVNAVAEVGRRRQVSNKLGKRAAKTAVRVE